MLSRFRKKNWVSIRKKNSVRNQPRKKTGKGDPWKNKKEKSKNVGNWWDTHKISWHNNDECHARESLLAKLKATNFGLTPSPIETMDRGKCVIKAKQSVIIATIKVQPKEPE